MQFNADLSNKCKSVKAVYIYASERSRYALSENDFVHYSMSTVSEILKAWSRQILLNCCWVSIFFDILIANISWTVAQTPINHIIFWRSLMRTFRCIYTSCFNRLRFLAENSTKLQKMNFFGQFKDHNLARKHGSWTSDPIFSSTFSAITVYNIHFCFWK